VSFITEQSIGSHYLVWDEQEIQISNEFADGGGQMENWCASVSNDFITPGLAINVAAIKSLALVSAGTPNPACPSSPNPACPSSPN
jgi:hypothetical protein